MCLGIPGEIVAIEPPSESELLQGTVSFGGVRKRICLAYVPHARIGDYAIIHAGFALDLVDEEHAREIFVTLAGLEASQQRDPPSPPGDGP